MHQNNAVLISTTANPQSWNIGSVFFLYSAMYNLMDGSIPVPSLLLLVRLLSIDLLRLLSMDR